MKFCMHHHFYMQFSWKWKQDWKKNYKLGSFFPQPEIIESSFIIWFRWYFVWNTFIKYNQTSCTTASRCSTFVFLKYGKNVWVLVSDTWLLVSTHIGINQKWVSVSAKIFVSVHSCKYIIIHNIKTFLAALA